jgi:exopolyphosphatase/guanosine-5'-triphosphate,3'-diphosphate pyrophosphatase
MAIEAALDIGSNSVKLLVADVDHDGGYRVILDENEVTGLASGLAPGGPLDAAAAARTLSCIGRFVARGRLLGATRFVAAGTSALRDAGDAQRFLERVRNDLQLDIHVLSGEDEARLSRTVAIRELPPGGPDLLFFDVGGGSLELTLLHGEEVRAETSLQLGARRATDAAHLKQPVAAEVRTALDSYIEERLGQGAPAAPAGAQLRLAGLGGTVSTAVWMLAGQRGEGQVDVHRSELTLEQLEGLLAAVAPLPLAELQQWPNLNPERAPVIYAGICIIVHLLRHYGAQGLTVTDRGLRYGLLLAPVAPARRQA